MTTKLLKVDEETHRRIKVNASINGLTMIEYVESIVPNSLELLE